MHMENILSSKVKILVVDDDHSMRCSLSDWLKSSEFRVCCADSGEEALKKIDGEDFNIVITDLKMPGKSGLDVLKYVKEVSLSTEVIVMTAYGTVETAVNAMKQGAYDYLLKPFAPEEIDYIIAKIIREQTLIRENRILKQQLLDRNRFECIIGKSNAMNKIFTLIEKIASSNISVLIQGESGTGKELVARAIHNASPRKESPFITVSCGALPESMLESELFGHEKGAFTGAINMKEGRFEMAHGGTLFLDEIAEMSQKSQVDLLRVLQEKEFRRVGGTEVIRADVRIVAATNKNLDREVEEERFREDLYYRLHVVPVNLSPLRDRHEDIPLLAMHFLEKYNKEHNRNIVEISPSAFDVLLQYDWPGNVRQLEHVVEHTMLMTSGEVIRAENLPERIRKKKKMKEENKFSENLSLKERMEEFERLSIISALQMAGGIKKEAAKRMQISPRILSYLLKKYNI